MAACDPFPFHHSDHNSDEQRAYRNDCRARERLGLCMADGALHMFEGWIVFLVCAGLLLVEVYVLTKLADGKPTLELPEFSADRVYKGRSTVVPLLAACVLLLLIGTGLTVYMAARQEPIPDRSRFVSFPNTLGEWKGRQSTLDASVEQGLSADDYILANYSNDKSTAVNVYIGYYSRRAKVMHLTLRCFAFLEGAGK